MWTVGGQTAKWQSGTVSAVLDGNAIASGLQIGRPGDSSWRDLRLGCAAWPVPEGKMDGSIPEVFLRDQHLVVNVDANQSHPLDKQLYWHVEPLEADDGVVLATMLFSVQTDKPGVPSTTEFAHFLPCDRWWITSSASDSLAWSPWNGENLIPYVSQEGGHVLLKGQLNDQWSCGLSCPANDLSLLEVSRADDRTLVTLRMTLFPGSLEKGVIRRSRLQFVVFRTAVENVQLPRLWSRTTIEPPLVS